MSPSTFFWLTLHRSDSSVSRRWAITLFLCFALMPTLGSTISFAILGGVLVALAYVALDPTRLFPLTRAEIWIGVIAISYFLFGFVRGVLAPSPEQGFWAALSSLGFVVTLPLLAVLRYFYEPYWDIFVRRAIAVGCILNGCAALIEIGFRLRPRAEALTGNPLIMAYLAGAWTLASTCLALSSNGRDRWLHWFAVASGLLSLVLSAGRGPMVAVVAIMLVILAWRLATATTTWLQACFRLYQLLVILTVAYVVLDYFGAINVVYGRFAAVFEFAAEPDAQFADGNLAIRLLMLRSGFEAFLQAPLFGYGRQNVMQVVANIGNVDLPFSHLHNAFLTEAVANGAIGLLLFAAVLTMPLIAAWRLPPPWGAIGVIWFSYTCLVAATNIGFSHDLMIFSYCLFILWLNALTAPENNISPSNATRYTEFISKQRVEPPQAIAFRSDAAISQ